MKIDELRINTHYKGPTGNVFTLFREYAANVECFKRTNGQLHYGREFIDYENGKPVLSLAPLSLAPLSLAPSEPAHALGACCAGFIGKELDAVYNHRGAILLLGLLLLLLLLL